MRIRWLILALLTITLLAATGCASSRHGRYGGGYGQTGPRIYSQRDRDYRWERDQRRRAEWLRQQQRKQERYERRRQRDYDRHHDRDRNWRGNGRRD